MSRFNLIDEKWIPVRFPDETRDELGIHDTLLRAKEIAAIEDPSPLVVAALHRFLLAVLYSALEGPTDIDKAKDLFRTGLPGEKITAYLDNWRDRFWLFDEKYPFGQVPDFQPKEWKAWTKIAAEHNADNAKVLFDHVDIKSPGSISFSAAARWLLAVQTFDLAVAKSEFVQPLDAPSARAIFFIVMGKTLHETLCLCLKPQPKHINDGDSPLWERKPECVVDLKSGKRKGIAGFADLYTWRSRAIIFQDGVVNGIRNLGFASGVSKANDSLFIDPMLCYVESKKQGFLPQKFQDAKEFWRDFDSLLPGGTNKIPLILDNAISLCRTTRDRWPIGILVCGQKTKSGQAKIAYWRMERFALPMALAGDCNIKTEIEQLLTEAAKAEIALERALRSAAKLSLAKGDRDLQADKWSAGRWVPGDVSKFIGKSNFETVPPVLSNYWSTIEFHFHEILRNYTVEPDSEAIRCQWLKHVRGALKKVWDQHRASVSIGDAWSIRALVKAEGPISRKLMELNAEIAKLKPQEEIV